MSRALALVLAVVATTPLSILAQKEPRRPKLPASADTNSATAYHEFGLNNLRSRPDEALAAFHWAARMEPGWAEPLYAKRVAYHLSAPHRLADYLLRRGYYRSKEVRAIDSLQNEALLRNPLLYRAHDMLLLYKWYEHETGISAAAADWRGPNPWFNGWLAYTRGRFPDAVRQFAEALKRDKKDLSTHVDRALAFYQMGQTDSAVAELRTMIGRKETAEQKDVVVFYDSKAFAEYMIGWMYELARQPALAREAYDRVIAEDLSFYMAHLRLGELARIRGDTATYLQEYQLAVDLKPESPFLQERYGSALVNAGRPADAVPHFEKAIAAEPLFAMPYFGLALALDRSDQKPQAIEQYTRFLGIAPLVRQQERAHAKQRIAALGGSAP